MAWLKRLVNIVRPDQLSRDLDRELEFHLSERADDLVAAGLSEGEARREAKRRFGYVPRIKERTRDVDVLGCLESMVADVRYAGRGLLQQRTFALVAVLCLALGIGANAAIFSLMDAVVLDSLPVARPEGLHRFTMGDGRYSVSNPLWEAIREGQDAFGETFAFSADNTVFNLERGGEARRVPGAWVSGGFFAALGVRPASGRLLESADDYRGCPAVAVVSHGFWQREYAGDPDVLLRTVSLDGQTFQIVGVTDPKFFGVEVGRSVQVYAPLCAEALVAGPESALDERSQRFLNVMGRLQNGIEPDGARSRLRAASAGIFQATLPSDSPPEFEREYSSRVLDFEPAARGVSGLRDRYRTSLVLLMSVVGLVLLIACANVATLLLTRATARRHEMAVRLALGAGRGRLIRQLLTESLLLSLIGATVGLVLARWGSALLVRAISTRTNSVWLDLSLDGRVLLFTTAVASATGLLFGVVPAWRAARVAPQAAMTAGGRGAVEGQRFTFGKPLLVGQIALSLVVVVTAGLLLGTFRTLATLDPGFQPEGVLLVRADMSGSRLGDEEMRLAARELLEQLRAVPGVSAASMSRITPVSGAGWNGVILLEGEAPPAAGEAMIWRNAVSDGFFATMGTELLTGRDFTEGDTQDAPRIAIVNQRLALEYFGSASPLGRQFRLRAGADATPPFEVVGVVQDAVYETLRGEAPPTAYLPLSQLDNIAGLVPAPVYELRGEGAPGALAAAVRATVARVDPTIALELVPFTDQVAGSLRRERLLATLSGFFATVALLLAVIGLYGTTAYSVARRKSEFGVRVALGAARARVVGLVLGEVAGVVLGGIALGALAALATTRWISSLLYAVEPDDPTTLLVAAVTLALAGCVAGAVPAWRAARLDPTVALRGD